MPQLPLNNALGLSGPPATTPERGLAGMSSTGKPATARAGARTPVNTAENQSAPSTSKSPGRARIADFMQTLALELRDQLDPAMGTGLPPGGAAAPPVQGLPASGKTPPPSLPADADETAEDAAGLFVVTGLMTLPVQPQAATDAKLAASLESTAAPQESGQPVAGANAERTAQRGLLAMLERQVGTNAPTEKGDAAALRTFAATIAASTGSAIDTSSFTAAVSASASGRDQTFTSAPTAQAVADGAPTAPSASSILPAAAPSDPTRTQIPVAHLEQPIGGSAWRDAVGHQVTWMVEQQVGRAELRLHPAHLGPIEVSVTVHNDEVNVSFQASHPATREALENSLPRLRELLGDSGLSLGQASVSQQFAGGQQTPEHAKAPEHGGGSRFDEGSMQIEAPATTRVRMGLLDAYA